ncbi:hypothetical protein Scep_011905 [Stephania cephalantha]|uniref:Uncharacterized protein n=1 Tax=Stephania cephalantha TaxID=152367 RepID=A0AAP0JG97_9MAGN
MAFHILNGPWPTPSLSSRHGRPVSSAPRKLTPSYKRYASKVSRFKLMTARKYE